MRNLKLLIMVLAMTTATAQDHHLASVKLMQGKELYILSEPVRPYEILNSRIHQRSGRMFQKESPGKQSISSKLEIIVRKMIKTSEKEGEDFDAIIYSEGKFAYPIRFTTSTTPETDGIAKVSLINSIPVFIMAEPLTKYSIVSDKRKKGNFSAFMSMGWDKEDIREVTTKFAKRFYKQFKTGEIDAIIYNYGNIVNGISFE